MEIAPGVHHFPTGPFNWYLIEERGRLTLVDGGFPGHHTVFEEGLRTLGRSVREVEAIVLTHAHADHMGFLEKVRRASGAPVFVHRADATAASRPRQLPWWGLLSNAWRPYMASVLTRATANGVFWGSGVDDVRLLDGDEELDVPGRPRVIHAPGHTPGQIALHLPARNVLLSSDVLITRHLLTGTAGAPQLAAPVLNIDHAQARRSLGSLRELGTVTLLPGHGRPWTGSLAEAVAAARG